MGVNVKDDWAGRGVCIDLGAIYMVSVHLTVMFRWEM